MQQVLFKLSGSRPLACHAPAGQIVPGRSARFTISSKHAIASSARREHSHKHTAISEGKWYKQGGGIDTEANKEDDKGKDEPHKIGYRTFPNGSAAHKYYRMLLKELTPNQDLNEVGHQCKSPKLSVLCLLA